MDLITFKLLDAVQSVEFFAFELVSSHDVCVGGPFSGGRCLGAVGLGRGKRVDAGRGEFAGIAAFLVFACSFGRAFGFYVFF